MFEGRANKIIVFFIYISIFVSSYIIAKKPAEIYIGYLIYILLLPLFILKHKFPIHLLVIASILLFSGIYNVYAHNDTYPYFIKVFLGLFFSYLFYYYVVAQSDFNIERLFQLYLLGCYIVSIIGAIQFISFLVGFRPGYDYSWILNKGGGVVPGGNFGMRVKSIFPEPTYFATCISGGMFVAVNNLFVKIPYYLTRFQSAFILVIYILSFSGVAYIAIFIAVIIILINLGFIRYILIFTPILIGTFYYLYNNVPEFRFRYDSTVNVFVTDEYSLNDTHGSSITLYENYQVAMKNFSTNFLFGTGLGSHPIAYEKYSTLKEHGLAILEGENSMDASSMLLRLISETGIFGTGVMLIILFKCFIKRDNEGVMPEGFWIVSGATFVIIFINLLRQGNYFLNGFPFFVWLYYYNYVTYKKYIHESKRSPSISAESSS